MILPLIKLETRRKELFFFPSFLALLMASLSSILVRGAYIDPQAVSKIFPTFYWIIFFASSSSGLCRAIDPEIERGVIERLALNKRLMSAFFWGKTGVIACSLFLMAVTLSSTFALTYPVAFTAGFWMEIAVLSLLSSISLSSLALIFSLILAKSEVRTILLPVLLFVIMYPLSLFLSELSIISILEEGSGTVLYLVLVWFNLSSLILSRYLFKFSLKAQ